MNIVVASAPSQLNGTFRRFGSVGPVYEIKEVIRQLDDGDWLLKVKIVQSGEEVEYRLNDALGDPRE